MLDTELEVSHLDPGRADVARQAAERVVIAAHAWAAASKQWVGSVTLPGDLDAARAFDAFFGARRELARHVGGEAAAHWAERALTTVSAKADVRSPSETPTLNTARV